jgi:hypothetical protein
VYSLPRANELGSGKSTIAASNVSAVRSSQIIASAFTTRTRGSRIECAFSAPSGGKASDSAVIFGSRSTSVACVTPGYFSTSRNARPSPPPRISTRRGDAAAMAGCTKAS